MKGKKTKKVKKGAKKSPQILTVDNLKKVPTLEKVLKSGKISIVLVFAEWCGACHRFRRNIWEPMCARGATHNRVAVRDDMIKNTSLANAKFDYLPSVLVVDENGALQSFKSPEGKDTNAMKTPKSLNEMERVVNVPVKSPPPFTVTNPMQPPAPEYLPIPEPEESELEIVKTRPTMTPRGITYKPTPAVAPPMVAQRGGAFAPSQRGGAFAPSQRGGGALLATLESIGQGVIPTAVLGALAVSMRGGTRKAYKKQRRNTRKAY